MFCTNITYATMSVQNLKEPTGCDIDRVTLSDHTQDYKIVLARKEVTKEYIVVLCFSATCHFRLYISIRQMNVLNVLLLKVSDYISIDIMIRGWFVCHRRESACSVVSRLPHYCLLWVNQKSWHWKVTMAIKIYYFMSCYIMNMHLFLEELYYNLLLI